MDDIKKSIEGKWATIEYFDGIVYGVYNELDIDIEAAMEVTADRKRIHDGVQAVLVVDVSKMKSVSKEARTYFSKHGSDNLNATAIIISSGFNTMMANFFMKVNFKKPQIPTKVFTNRAEAEEWISKYK